MISWFTPVISVVRNLTSYEGKDFGEISTRGHKSTLRVLKNVHLLWISNDFSYFGFSEFKNSNSAIENKYGLSCSKEPDII